jgi:hypothetical protein
MREPACVPNSHIVLNASTGDFLLAMTARLEIKIEKIAAANGAAIAKPTLLGDSFLVSTLLILHLSSLSQVVQE